MHYLPPFAWVPTQATFQLSLSLHNYLQIVGNHPRVVPFCARFDPTQGDYMHIYSYKCHICLSTYSGNFLVDDQLFYK
jgi:hypothetical protein